MYTTRLSLYGITVQYVVFRVFDFYLAFVLTDLSYFFIQIPYRVYVHHVAADRLVNLPTKLAAISLEWCCWTVCGYK